MLSQGVLSLSGEPEPEVFHKKKKVLSQERESEFSEEDWFSER